MEELMVVLDVNVLIDLCRVEANGRPLPTRWSPPLPTRPAIARQLYAALTTPLRPEVLVVVDDDLIAVLRRKLTQPTDRQRDEDCGLGWTEGKADETIISLIQRLRPRRISPSAGEQYVGDQALDHEDRRVWGLFQEALGGHPTYLPCLLTYDGAFARAGMAAAPRLQSGRLAWIASKPHGLLAAIDQHERVPPAPPDPAE